jgi:hypothetical protein
MVEGVQRFLEELVVIGVDLQGDAFFLLEEVAVQEVDEVLLRGKTIITIARKTLAQSFQKFRIRQGVKIFTLYGR